MILKRTLTLLVAAVMAGVFVDCRASDADASPVQISDSDAMAKASAIWQAEMQGDTARELELAAALSNVTTPSWAAEWAKGVVRRLNGIGKGIEMEFTAVSGNRCDLRQMRGKVVLINFWATWCAPCIESLPKLKSAYAKHHAEGLEVVGVSWDSDLAKLTAFLADNSIGWPNYFDGTKPGKWGNAYGIGGVPYVMLVDRAGQLRYCGADEVAAIEKELPKLLAEPSP